MKDETCTPQPPSEPDHSLHVMGWTPRFPATMSGQTMEANVTFDLLAIDIGSNRSTFTAFGVMGSSSRERSVGEILCRGDRHRAVAHRHGGLSPRPLLGAALSGGRPSRPADPSSFC